MATYGTRRRVRPRWRLTLLIGAIDPWRGLWRAADGSRAGRGRVRGQQTDAAAAAVIL